MRAGDRAPRARFGPTLRGDGDTARLVGREFPRHPAMVPDTTDIPVRQRSVTTQSAVKPSPAERVFGENRQRRR
ncbi:uncharacterized protein RMCN_3020 [Mycolicibacterium novocastrense]|uniref:Uncharacterized protein n=1 Tax=Mycolicibacterium novocastrense TaxID=59813 RepID=A0ABQ0KJW3_MYCNV|nr:uncharacterized protein RMCN_3020 [Mycolicibacterium novocastrense]